MYVGSSNRVYLAQNDISPLGDRAGSGSVLKAWSCCESHITYCTVFTVTCRSNAVLRENIFTLQGQRSSHVHQWHSVSVPCTRWLLVGAARLSNADHLGQENCCFLPLTLQTKLSCWASLMILTVGCWNMEHLAIVCYSMLLKTDSLKQSDNCLYMYHLL
jgi:hypothetical protein